jgi:type VI secretion system protein VasD
MEFRLHLHRVTRNAVVCVILLETALIQGCASTERAVAIPYQIELLADANVNPDLKNRPSPIVVRIFELRGDSSFEESSFFSLKDNSEQTLGHDLISSDRIVIRPGDKQQINRSGSPDARSIGIIAEYRDLESNHWRKVITLPPPRQLNPYKFWQTSPDQLKARIAVKNGGIELLRIGE